MSIRVKDTLGGMKEMSYKEAKNLAYQQGLDLICLDKKNQVFLIADEGKYLYEQKKKKKEMQKKSKQLDSKTVRMLPNIAENDLNIKIKHIQEWLADGRTVKIEMRFKGRMMAHQDIGKKVLEQICEETGLPCRTSMMGNTMSLTLRPVNNKKRKKTA